MKTNYQTLSDLDKLGNFSRYYEVIDADNLVFSTKFFKIFQHNLTKPQDWESAIKLCQGCRNETIAFKNYYKQQQQMKIQMKINEAQFIAQVKDVV